MYRKGELSWATIDRDWPHQLALSAEYLRGKNCVIVQRVLTVHADAGTPRSPIHMIVALSSSRLAFRS